MYHVSPFVRDERPWPKVRSAQDSRWLPPPPARLESALVEGAAELAASPSGPACTHDELAPNGLLDLSRVVRLA